jgi:type II secretory pathway pseudopilin PulG
MKHWENDCWTVNAAWFSITDESGEPMKYAGMHPGKNRAGFSLIEIMVAILLLVVLVIGSAAMMYQTGGTIQRQQNKREALLAANAVMEEYWSNTSYDALFGLDGSSIETNVPVNGISMGGLVSIDAVTDEEGKECVEITVGIDYLGAQDNVEISARRYRRGLSKVAL